MSARSDFASTPHCNQPSQLVHDHASKRVLRVLILTFVCMVVEIAFGTWTHSLALLADGWHMGTHVAAFAITIVAYRLAARFARDPRYARLFCWGPWKIEVLGGFASSLLLFGVAVAVVWESFERFFQPAPIAFDEAIVVALIGLAVNLLSAWWLHGDGHGGHAHGHGHHHEHDHERKHDRAHEHDRSFGHVHTREHEHSHAHEHIHEHEHFDKRTHSDKHDHARERDTHASADLNLRGAYLHVIADAATSVLAIAALLGGRSFGWIWLDAAVGLLGAGLIATWSIGLARDSARVLLDAEMDAHVVEHVRGAIEDPATRVLDLHVWRVGRDQYSVAVSLQTSAARTSTWYRERLAPHDEIVHATIEVQPMPRSV